MIDGDAMQDIMYDVAAGRSVEQSKLTYTPEMREWRAKVEAEWTTYRKANPDAELYVPPELPKIS